MYPICEHSSITKLFIEHKRKRKRKETTYPLALTRVLESGTYLWSPIPLLCTLSNFPFVIIHTIFRILLY